MVPITITMKKQTNKQFLKKNADFHHIHSVFSVHCSHICFKFAVMEKKTTTNIYHDDYKNEFFTVFVKHVDLTVLIHVMNEHWTLPKVTKCNVWSMCNVYTLLHCIIDFKHRTLARKFIRLRRYGYQTKRFASC